MADQIGHGEGRPTETLLRAGRTLAEMAPSILIVDDHAVFRARARRLLEAAGYDVVGEAEDAAGAMTETRRLSPDVVLLDVQLPDADGFSAAASLCAEPRPPRVVLISSREASDYGTRLESSPAIGFIHKLDLSRAAVEQLIGGAA